MAASETASILISLPRNYGWESKRKLQNAKLRVRLGFPDAQEFNTGLYWGVVQYFPATQQVFRAINKPLNLQ